MAPAPLAHPRPPGGPLTSGGPPGQPRCGPRAGRKYFLRWKWEASFLVPLRVLQTPSVTSRHQVLGHFFQPGVPSPPALSIKMLSFQNTGLETYVHGLVQREGPHPALRSLPPPAAPPLSCHVIITMAIIIIESSKGPFTWPMQGALLVVGKLFPEKARWCLF